MVIFFSFVTQKSVLHVTFYGGHFIARYLKSLNTQNMAFMPQDFKSASLSQPPGTEQVNFVSVL